MKASWWQTLVLAITGAIIPFLETIVSGGDVNFKVACASVGLAVLMSVSNILRSPVQNPPTMIQSPPK